MLVRFIQSGPVKAGPVTLHGLPGQIADLDGADLSAAVEAGVVEVMALHPLDHYQDGRKSLSKPRKKVGN